MRYDPDLAPFAALIPRTDFSDVAAARTLYAQAVAMQGEPDARGVEWSELSSPAVRLYRPSGGASQPETGPEAMPAILYLHGGGFMVGSTASEHAWCLKLCRDLGALVVSVEYRLAPEHPYPAALDDSMAALRWVSDNADELGIDPARIAVRGISAGAGLAAALTLRTRAEGGPRICFQLLVSPVLDDRMQTPSMLEFTETPMWDSRAAEISWTAYLAPHAPGADSITAFAAPARATDLSELPRAYISVMEFDPLRDEGIAYAQALQAAGTSVELHQFPGAFHASARFFPDAQISRRELAEEVAVLRRALSR